MGIINFFQRLVLVSVLIGMGTCGYCQAVYYQCGFETTQMPTDMAYYDLDKLPLKDYAKKAGFEVGKPWVILKESSTGKNYFAGSTSDYATPGTANDWMITPAIKIFGKGSQLKWKGIVCDNSDKRDGYQVLVSTKGVAVEDFEVIPLFSIAEESSEDWVEHIVSLDDYAGKIIHIAFVNNSTQKYVLGIDDIEVSGPEPYVQFKSLDKRYTDQAATPVKVQVTCLGDQPITSVTAHYKVEEEVYSTEFTNLNIKKGESAELEIAEKLPLGISQEKTYQVWIEVDGDALIPQVCTMGRLTFLPNQKVLIEEGTGTWCGFCVQGMVAMEFLKEKYPHNFIGIVGHNGDAMEYSPYFSKLGFSGLPAGLVNRKYTLSPMFYLNDSTMTTLSDEKGNMGFERALLNELSEGTYASVEVTGSFTNKNPVALKGSFEIKSTFGKSIKNANYRFAAVLIENKVQNDLYTQSNYMSGYKGYLQTSAGTVKGFAGYEDKGEAIFGTDMVYNDVVRCIFESFNGFSKSIPATSIQAGTTVSYTGSFDLSSFGKELGFVHPDYVELVVMLIDMKDGSVVNANKVEMGDPESIFTTLPATADISVFKSVHGCEVLVTADNAGEVLVELWSVDGKLAAADKKQVENSCRFVLNCREPLKGVYIVKAHIGEKIITRKIIL